MVGGATARGEFGAIVPLVLLALGCSAVPVDPNVEPVAAALIQHLRADPHLTESADYQGLVMLRPATDQMVRDFAARIERGEAPTLSVAEELQIAGSADHAANPLTLDVLLAGLQSRDVDVREHAKNILLRPRFRASLRGLSPRLRPLLSDHAESEPSCELLGLLDLPEDLHTALVSQSRTPWHVRARLGDAVSEARLLEQFAAAGPLGRGNLAKRLFYANTPAAWAAFTDALGSGRTHVNYLGQEVSEAFYLINAYAEYFDAALFRWPAYQHLLYIRGEDFRARGAEVYFRRISDEIERAQGVSIHVRADLLVSHEAWEIFDAPTGE